MTLSNTLLFFLVPSQGDSDKKKSESTSSYNYRVVKEVPFIFRWIRSNKIFSNVPEWGHAVVMTAVPVCFSDPAASQQAVCPGGSFRQEEQEAAAETAEEHGGPQCGPGAAADPL